MNFGQWYADNQRRFHCGHFNTREIAYAAWRAGREAADAAPELLEACKAMLQAAIDGEYSCDSQGNDWPEIAQAKVAIAKAEGES